MSDVPVHKWLADRLTADVERQIARVAGWEDVRRVAIMPDVHLSHDASVGTVFATSRLIYPAAIGGDIGCGILAAAFDVEADAVSHENVAVRILSELSQQIPINRHRRPRAMPAMEPAHPALAAVLRRDAAVEFATLGRGNHFLELQADDTGRLWIMIHSGSRALGPAVRDAHVRDGTASLATDSEVGQSFLHDMELARRYAAGNRLGMLEIAADIVKRIVGGSIDPTTIVQADHNHIARETHFNEQVFIHRKGANRAAEGVVGLIPGSAGSRSFHTIGRGDLNSLHSSSHGAGRALSRSAARARFSVRDVGRQMHGTWFDPRHFSTDEAPDAYRDIRRVMRAQTDLVRIVRTLEPILSYKGG